MSNSNIAIIKWANSLGITEAVNGSWIEAIARHYGDYGGKPHIQSIANSLGVTEAKNGSWLQAIAEKQGVDRGMWMREIAKTLGNRPENPGNSNKQQAPQGPTIKNLNWESNVGTTNVGYAPLYGLYDYSVYVTIIKADELSSDIEIINKIQVQLGGYSSGYQVDNQIIKLGHTSKGLFSWGDTYTSITAEHTLTQVVNSPLTIINGWNELTFDTNFEWNGTDNIILIWENRDGSWKSGYGWGETHTVTNYQTMHHRADGSFPSTINLLPISSRINLKLGY